MKAITVVYVNQHFVRAQIILEIFLDKDTKNSNLRSTIKLKETIITPTHTQKCVDYNKAFDKVRYD